MRRVSSEVRFGPVVIGGGAPVAVQTMCDTRTGDVEATVEQVGRIREAGCRIVRVAVPGMAEVEAVREIARQVRGKWGDVALVGDVHFLPEVAFELAGVVDKVRINPGNYNAEKFEALVERCRDTGTAIRIGVNHGSVGDGDMVEAAMGYLRVCRAVGFDQVVVSMKASDVGMMVGAYKRLVEEMEKEGMAYPLHLGVTEAGNGLEGRVKSAVGIGALLVDGIGDTIRVSLTEPPEAEIPVARAILQACGLDKSRAEIIACPGCGRTLYELGPVLERVKEAVGHVGGVKVAVMGCIVNGPGEMADADYGYVGAGPGEVTLYRGKEAVKRGVAQEEAVEELVELMREDGRI